MKLSHVEVTHVGLTRKENQDSIFALPEHGVFLVADGMGGEKAGAEASAQVVATVNRLMSEYFQKFDPQKPTEVESLAKKALEMASREVVEIAVREPEKAGMGSTGSLLMLYKGAYFIAQVGDSRVYLLRRGKVQQLTRDHTIVWTLYESGILTRGQLETHPDRHLLTQCIGGSKPVEVELFADRVQQGDVFLICSDGLTGYAGEDKVMKLLADQIYSMEELGQRLLQAALEGGGGDNVSIILVKVDALDPSDNWTLDGHPTPKFAPAVVAPPPKPEVPKQLVVGRPPAHRMGLYAALFFLVAIVLLALAILKRRQAYVEVRFATDRELNLADIAVYDQAGEEIDLSDATFVDNTLALTLPKNAEYRVTLESEGIVPVDEAVDLSAYAGEAVEIPVREYGTLEVEPPVTETIEEMRIAELERTADPDAEGDEANLVYEYPNLDDTLPRLSHALKPGTPHKITIKDSKGRVMSFKVEIPPGGSETISAEF